jgi:hypothetical protein
MVHLVLGVGNVTIVVVAIVAVVTALAVADYFNHTHRG